MTEHKDEEQPKLIFRGESVVQITQMLSDITLYLTTVGFPGFLAWLDQNCNNGCSCGKKHVPDAQAARENLMTLRAATNQALANPEYSPAPDNSH
jgi:hypothetical protein